MNEHKNSPEKLSKNAEAKQKNLEFLSGQATNKHELDVEKQNEQEQIKFEGVIGRTEFTQEELAESQEKDQQVIDLMKHLAEKNSKNPLNDKDIQKFEDSLSKMSDNTV